MVGGVTAWVKTSIDIRKARLDIEKARLEIERLRAEAEKAVRPPPRIRQASDAEVWRYGRTEWGPRQRNPYIPYNPWRPDDPSVGSPSPPARPNFGCMGRAIGVVGAVILLIGLPGAAIWFIVANGLVFWVALLAIAVLAYLGAYRLVSRLRPTS